MIPFNKPYIIGNELNNISQAITDNLQISGGGKFTRECQQWLGEKLSCRKSLLTHSCTAALEMAAILLDIQPGDEIIMPSFTFVSTANAFVLRGGVPVFIDIRSDTLNLDEKLIKAAITDRTRAIVPVHYAGLPCEMDAILDIAHRYDLRIVEDAAQALMSEYKGKSLGTLGHLGALSFHETKNIICGEGGALLINDEKLIARAEIIWEKGTDRAEFFRGETEKYTWIDIGSSFLPSDMMAAFLFAQFRCADEIITKRIELCQRYSEGLETLQSRGYLELPHIEPDSTTNGHIFFILCNSAQQRTELISFLKQKGIDAVFHYIPLHSSPAGLKYGRCSGSLAITDDISRRILRLPLYYQMTEDEQESVISTISSFFLNSS